MSSNQGNLVGETDNVEQPPDGSVHSTENSVQEQSVRTLGVSSSQATVPKRKLYDPKDVGRKEPYSTRSGKKNEKARTYSDSEKEVSNCDTISVLAEPVVAALLNSANKDPSHLTILTTDCIHFALQKFGANLSETERYHTHLRLQTQLMRAFRTQSARDQTNQMEKDTQEGLNEKNRISAEVVNFPKPNCDNVQIVTATEKNKKRVGIQVKTLCNKKNVVGNLEKYGDNCLNPQASMGPSNSVENIIIPATENHIDHLSANVVPMEPSNRINHPIVLAEESSKGPKSNDNEKSFVPKTSFEISQASPKSFDSTDEKANHVFNQMMSPLLKYNNDRNKKDIEGLALRLKSDIQLIFERDARAEVTHDL